MTSTSYSSELDIVKSVSINIINTQGYDANTTFV